MVLESAGGCCESIINVLESPEGCGEDIEYQWWLGKCAFHCSEGIYVWEDVLPSAVWEYRLYDLGEAGQPLEFIRLLGKCVSQCSESIYVWEDVLPIAMGI